MPFGTKTWLSWLSLEICIMYDYAHTSWSGYFDGAVLSQSAGSEFEKKNLL